ncbi:sensor histidine kinase [Hydrogenophaga atypica]|uniref:histidine kinase n=1 Tax=Hydrogenophaga atypica TaxID=249409 RepID=A0ABW2QFI3_9BURK
MSLPEAADHLPEDFFTELFNEPAAALSAAENERLRGAGFLTRVLDHLPGLVSYFDHHLVCHYANHAQLRHLPHPADSAVGLAVQQVFVPELLEAMLPGLAQALRGVPQAFEARVGHAQRGHWVASGQLVPDVDGDRVLGLYCHIADISAERLPDAPAAPLTPPTQTLGEHLSDGERRLRLMLDGLRDHAVYFLDTEGRVSEWTSSAERLLGHPAHDVLGTDARRFDAPDVREDERLDAELALERAALFGQFESTGWRQRQDGSRFWGHTVLTALRGADGEPLGFSALTRDMTEVRRLQELLQDLNQTLEVRVQDRTRQLLEANRDLESFSSSVSHDLRAPLRHITSFIAILQEHLAEQADDTTRKHLNTIADAAQRMGALIEGLLAFSRLGLAPLQKREVGMATQVSASINRLTHDIGAQQVDWTVAPDLPAVLGDPLLISQVWDNLLSNALKYSRQRERSVVQVGWHPDAERGCVYWVRDNGVGFEPRQAHRLFGVFQRLHRASEFEGTGIGLALCRRILERHGGHIWAESTPGEGSCFYFALPPGGGACLPP